MFLKLEFPGLKVSGWRHEETYHWQPGVLLDPNKALGIPNFEFGSCYFMYPCLCTRLPGKEYFTPRQRVVESLQHRQARFVRKTFCSCCYQNLTGLLLSNGSRGYACLVPEPPIKPE